MRREFKADDYLHLADTLAGRSAEGKGTRVEWISRGRPTTKHQDGLPWSTGALMATSATIMLASLIPEPLT